MTLTVERDGPVTTIIRSRIETRNAMGFKCLDNLDAFFGGREPPDRLV